MSAFHTRCVSCMFAFLLIFVSTTRAACTDDSLALELVAATGTDATSHPLAKCYSSLKLSVDTSCTLTITSNNGNNFVQSLWSDRVTYSSVMACPTLYSQVFADAPADSDVGTLLAGAIWANTPVTAPTVVSATGSLTITSSGATLKFRPITRTGSGTNGVFSTIGAPSCTGTVAECATAATGCVAGRRSLPITGLENSFVCALCGAGTYSGAAASTCSKCASGTANGAVGGTSDSVCVNCNAGAYSSTGSSDCRPCALGTFAPAAQASSCSACPTGWSAHLPGAIECVKCVAGRAFTCATTSGSGCESAAGSSGDFTARVVGDTLTAKATWDNTFAYPIVAGTCAESMVQLAVTVSDICVVQVQALGSSTTTSNGKKCSDPSNSGAVLTAYYTATDKITSRLATANGNVVIITTNSDAHRLVFSVVAATTDPNNVAALASTSVQQVLGVTGGEIATATAESASCYGGTYQVGSGIGSLSCVASPVGQYSLDNAMSPTDCPIGTANDILGVTTCDACTGSTYAADEGLSTCDVCADTVTTDSGKNIGCSTDVTVCGAGQTFDGGANMCLCSAGYGTTDNAATCTACISGEFSVGGTESCATCPAGTYSKAESAVCSSCPVGTANDGNGNCNRCLKGKEPGPTGSACADCADGWYNPPATDDATLALYPKCKAIPAGKKSADKLAVTDCAAQTYSMWTDDTTRVPTDGTSCQACPEATTSAAGSKRCTSCPGGTYTAAGSSTCTRCLEGTSRAAFSANSCDACPIGSDTAGKKGASKCRNCSPGQYAGVGSTSICSDCPANTATADFKSSSCEKCPAGTDTDGETGMSDCTDCSPGSANAAPGGSCSQCPPGQYQSDAGQLKCRKCDVGRFSQDPGAESCEGCAPGTYQARPGATSCRTCPGGTWSAGSKGSCKLCDKGYYAEAGSKSCTKCGPGYFSSLKGQEACSIAPAGSFVSASGLTSATKCSAGSYQNKEGKTGCSLCPAKTYSSAAGATKCSPCASAKKLGTTSCSRRRSLLGRFASFL